MSRTDLSDQIATVPGTQTVSTSATSPYADFNTSSVTNYPTIASEITVTRRGSTTPNFREHRAAGHLIPPNSFYYRKQTRSAYRGILMEVSFVDPTYLTTRTSVRSGDWGLVGVYPSSMPGGDVATLIAEVDQKLLEQIKDQKINLMQLFAEREATSKTVLDTVVKLCDAFRKAKKGNFSGAMGALGLDPRGLKDPRGRRKNAAALSQRWLALQYGWKPLMGDIYGAVEALNELHNDQPPFQKAFARRKKTWEKSINQMVGVDYHTLHETDTTEVSSAVYFEVPAPPIRSLGSLGIMNPATIAWELLPWSFVIDWFIPIGSFLNTLDATSGASFVAGYRTVHSRRRATSAANYRAHPAYQFRTGGVTGWTEILEVNRVKLTTWPTISRPRFKNPISAGHAANALALLITTFSKR